MPSSPSQPGRRLARVGLWCGLAGIMVAVILFGALRLRLSLPTGALLDEITICCLWPSSILLLTPRGGLGLLAVSIGINAVLYALLGSICWYGITRRKPLFLIPILLIFGSWWWLITAR